MTAEHLPSHLQQRADAELGAAWRRCKAALPEGWGLTLVAYARGYAARVFVQQDGDQFGRSASDPAAALTALAEALESR